MDELEKATVAYENALRHNPFKVSTLAAAAEVYRRSARPALAVTTSVQEPLIIFPVPTSLSVSSLSSPSLCVPSVCPARPPLLAKVPRGAQAREPAQGVRLSPARGEGALSRTCLSSTPFCTRFRLTFNPPPARLVTRCADPVSTVCLAQIEPTNGELWERLAFTYLLSDDLQNAYTAYQHALFHLPNPKDTQVRRGPLQAVRLARGQPPCALHRTDALP